LNRPHAAARAARFFVEKFPGKSLYAVKANPSPDLLRVLWDAGVTHYDVASIAEVAGARHAAGRDAVLHAPGEGAPRHCRGLSQLWRADVQPRPLDELEKIRVATDGATDLTLCVRLRVSSEHSELSLASKFGCDLVDARELLQQTRQLADCLGVCFHVGSQAMSPHAYVLALEKARAAIVDAAVTVDIIDVGGASLGLSGHGAAAARRLLRADRPHL
jgi:ornithine decarboxylase